MAKRRIRSFSKVFSFLSALWGLWSFATAAKDFPEDFGEFTDMMESPPIFVPWLFCAAFLVLLFWASMDRDADGDTDSPTTSGPNSPIVKGNDNDLMVINKSDINVSGNDHRKGNFNNGTIHGDQVFYDRPPARSVPSDLFAGCELGVQPKAIVRPAESDLERSQFSQSLATALNASGIAAQIQNGYSQNVPPFLGVQIHFAPNEAAELLAKTIADALAQHGLSVSVGDKMAGWGDDNILLLLIGECG